MIAIVFVFFLLAGGKANTQYAKADATCSTDGIGDGFSLLSLKATPTTNSGGAEGGLKNEKTAQTLKPRGIEGKAAQRSFNCRTFRAGIGKGPGKRSNCPNDEVWLRRMRDAGDLVYNSFMDVGCNTGIDAVRFLKMFGNQDDVMAKWKKQLASKFTDEGACSENALVGNDFGAGRTSWSRSSWSNPKVFCVEPGPSTFELLEETRRNVFGSDSPLTVVQVAGSDHEGTGHFQGDKTGSEIGHLSEEHGANDVLVRVTTVDQLISEYNLTGLDGLLIDAECYDYSVLAGSTNALRTLRYLVFEVTQTCPQNTPSNRLTLYSQVQMLDAQNFDCFFAGNIGRVQRLTGCWKESDEAAHHPLQWTNVVCVKRGDIWHSIFEELDTGI